MRLFCPMWPQIYASLACVSAVACATPWVKKATIDFTQGRYANHARGVAVLYAKTSNEGATTGCSAFFVAPGIALTAAHCLHELRHGASCRGKVRLFVPDESRRTDVFDCVRILHALEVEYPEKPLDYAVIQTDRPERSVKHVLSVHYAPVPEGTVLFSSPNGPPCVSVYGSLPNLIYDNPDAAKITLSCQTNFGDSGAPLFDQMGNVRAILNGGTGARFMKSIDNYSPLLIEEFKPLSLATSLGCIDPATWLPRTGCSGRLDVFKEYAWVDEAIDTGFSRKIRLPLCKVSANILLEKRRQFPEREVFMTGHFSLCRIPINPQTHPPSARD